MFAFLLESFDPSRCSETYIQIELCLTNRYDVLDIDIDRKAIHVVNAYPRIIDAKPADMATMQQCLEMSEAVG